jgi:anti-sigma-K factor RskA
VAAVFDQQTRTLRLTATITVPADRAAELWRIGSDNVPRALGLLTGQDGPIRLGEDHVLQADEVIAISIEPLGGSPTGSPTGEVIASGALRPT